jgi:NTP pyrophosphatase (non-canonical NTP hydrolase)
MKEIAYEARIAMGEIAAEHEKATANWPAFNSAHEGFAVLKEEVDELWDHVKTNQKRRDLVAMRKEAIQVAAMALRFAAECCGEETGRK